MFPLFAFLRRSACSLRPLGLIGVGVLSTLGALSLTHLGPVQAQSPGVNLTQLVAQVSTLKAQVAVLQAKTAPLSVSGSLFKIEGVNVQIDDGTGATGSTSGLGNLTLGYDEGAPASAKTGSHNLILGVYNHYTSSGGLVAGYGNSISAPFASVSGGVNNTASGTYASVSGGNGNTASGQATYAPVVAGPQGAKGDTGAPGTNGKNGLQGPKGDTGPQGNTGAPGPKGDTGLAGAGFTPDKIAVLKALSLSSDPSAGGTNTLLTISGVNVQIVNGLGSTETQNGLGNLTVGYNELRGDGTDNRKGSHNIITGIYNNYSSSGGLLGGYGNSLSGVEEFVVGANNTAGGHQSTVSGGFRNNASGDYASVSGGSSNTASGLYASVSGGYQNTASGNHASVSGGEGNTASGNVASVTGGNHNTASGIDCVVSGGNLNTATGANIPGQTDSATVSGGYNRYQSHAGGWTGGYYHTDSP
jgi:hypothetical protein